MFRPLRGAKKGISSWTNTNMQGSLYPLSQNQSPPFLLSSLFWKLPQPSRIHPLIFLWTPTGFISAESFLNFSWNLYIPLWLQKSFKFIVLSYCKYICGSINICTFVNLFIFPQAPKQNSPHDFYHYPPGRWELLIPPEQCFLKIFFPEQKRGWEDYGVKKITKINKGIGHKFWCIPPSLQPLH